MPSASKSVILVGTTVQTHAALISTARRLFANDYIHVVTVLGRETPEHTRALAEHLSDEVIDLSRPNTTLSTSLGVWKSSVIAVWCLQERDIGLYISISHFLGFINDEQAHLYALASHKGTFKETLGLSAPNLIPVHMRVSVDDLSTFSPESYPVVAKPTGLSASRHVRILKNTDDLTTYRTDIPTILEDYKNYGSTPEFIFEQFIEGTQYSFNAYIDWNGSFSLCPVLKVIPAFKADPDCFDTYSAFETSSHELSDTDRDAAVEAIAAIVEVFQLRGLTAHFDACLTASGWKFFEIGLRSGGNRHQIYEEINAMDHRYNDLLVRIGHKVSIPEPFAHATLVQKAAREPGILRSISLPNTASKPETVTLRQLKPFSTIGTRTRPAAAGGEVHVKTIVSGSDPDAVFAHANHIFVNTNLRVEAAAKEPQ